MTGERVEIETTGETVGEARWAALHELERRYPAIDRDAVEFVVVSEGERGLLGVGYEPARVVASVTVDSSAVTPVAPPQPAAVQPPRDEPPEVARVRALLERLLDAFGVAGRVDLAVADGVVTATITGSDLGLVIGKHGQTIDAIQYLANAISHRRDREAAVEVVVDAEGYRKRRERTLHEVAGRAAADVRRTGEPVELEPMTSVERKIVHSRVQEMDGLTTASEGVEPNRYVVVRRSDDGDV
jgi:spoIIIJ-associated protein